MPPVSEQDTVKVDAMKRAKLDEPSNVVGVFIWKNCNGQKHTRSIAQLGTESTKLSVILGTLVMVKVNEKNRNVDLFTMACNWEANEQTEKIRFLSRSALKNNRNHLVILKSTIVPNESAEECRKLMVTIPKLVKLTLNQEINCFLPVRL